jgi:hypothetical protein
MVTRPSIQTIALRFNLLSSAKTQSYSRQ